MMNSLKKLTSKLHHRLLIIIVLGVLAIIVLYSALFLFLPKSSIPTFKHITLPSLDAIPEQPIQKPGTKKPIISARHAALFDVESGTMLTGINEDQSIPIASVTKVMSSLVVLDHYKLNDVLTVSKNAAETIGSSMFLKADEQITVDSLLHGLLINSGNDAGHTLAESYNTNIDSEQSLNEFVTAMNKKAKEIGMVNTVYKDPVGLNDEGRSTARDQAILLTYALKDKTFRSIIHTSAIEVTSSDGKIKHTLDNSNRLVKEEMLYSGIIGGKTGFTPSAGHSLVTAATRDNHTLVAVVFNTYSTAPNASALEAKKLLDWGFNNFSWIKL